MICDCFQTFQSLNIVKKVSEQFWGCSCCCLGSSRKNIILACNKIVRAVGHDVILLHVRDQSKNNCGGGGEGWSEPEGFY